MPRKSPPSSLAGASNPPNCRMMSKFETRFASGDKSAILDAVYHAARFGAALPEWAASAFQNAYKAVRVNFDLRSWDDAFGKPGRGRKLAANKQRAQLAWAVYWRVRETRELKPKPQDIFDTVGS